MPRTTLDIDGPILKDLKRLQRREKKSLGRLASDLLAEALSHRTVAKGPEAPFHWISKPLGLRVDLSDRETVWQILDGDDLHKSGEDA